MRRNSTTLLAGISLFASIQLSPASAEHADGALMFRGNLAHTGVYAGQAVPSNPAIKWVFRTKGEVNASPAIANGLAYVGSTDGRLYAVDITTGQQKWQFKTGSRVVSSPAVANGSVFFESYDGFLYALDTASGALNWKFATGGERRFAGTHLHGALPINERMPDPFDAFLSSPAVWNGAVYFGSGDGNIYAVDAGTGALKWKVTTGDVVHASPAIANGTVYIGSWDSYFYALDAVTGALKWRFKTGEDPDIHNQVGIQSSAVVANGAVYFGCRDSNLYALDAKNGRKLWSFNNGGSWVVGSPAWRDGRLYVDTSDSGKFYVFDAKSGVPSLALDFKHWPMFSSPALVGNFAYFGSHTGRLVAVDLRSGQIAWQFATEASKTNGPTYTKADGTPNYAAAVSGNFYDDLVSGQAKMMSVGAILSSPVVVGGTIYFGSTDGNLYALG